MEFETTISAGERPQNYALDRAATGTGGEELLGRKILRYAPSPRTMQRRRSLSWYITFSPTRRHPRRETQPGRQILLFRGNCCLHVLGRNESKENVRTKVRCPTYRITLRHMAEDRYFSSNFIFETSSCIFRTFWMMPVRFGFRRNRKYA